MKFDISHYLIDDIENSDHPSDFQISGKYAMLILRLPYIKNGNVDVVSYAFLIKEDTIYRYDRQKRDFLLLGTFDDLYRYLDIRIDKILAKLSKLHAQIAKVEDRLYDNHIDSDFPNQWLMFKKELALIERLMGHSMIAYSRFMKHFKNRISQLAFGDLEEHIDRAYRFSRNAIEKLDYLYSFYRAKMDEKTNKIMFILTIISAVFLPLTLITGYFGMNTGGLPFVDDPAGTLKVTGMLLLFEIPFILWILKLMRSD